MIKKAFNKLLLIIFVLICSNMLFLEPSYAWTFDGHGEFKDVKPSYYYLDSISLNDAEEKKTGWWVFPDLAEETGNMFFEIINLFANLVFALNVYLTKLMLFIYDLSYDFSIINDLAGSMSNVISDTSGITNGKFSSDKGLFGVFGRFIVLFSVIYAIFSLLWRKSIFDSLGTILKTTVVLALSVLLLTNYSSFLTITNSLSNEITGRIMSGNVLVKDDKSSVKDDYKMLSVDDTNVINDVQSNLWSLFVDRPYLVMQFGTSNLEEIGNQIEENGGKYAGKERVKKTLKYKAFSEEREKVVSKEARTSKGGYGNENMLHSNLIYKLPVLFLTVFLNGITSIPIYGISFALIFFQFWFMIMALVAPFVLLVAAIPGQFRVLRSYSFELFLPLFLKIAFSIIALFLSTVSGVMLETMANVKSVSTETSGALNELKNTAKILTTQFLLFASIFLLRNRIKGIFSNGSESIKRLREEAHNRMYGPIKGGAKVVGASAGLAVAGPQGALSGANIGDQFGRLAAGETTSSDALMSASRGAVNLKQLQYMDRLNDINKNNANSDEVDNDSKNTQNIPNEQQEQDQHDKGNEMEELKNQEQEETEHQNNSEENVPTDTLNSNAEKSPVAPTESLKCENCGSKPCVCDKPSSNDYTGEEITVDDIESKEYHNQQPHEKNPMEYEELKDTDIPSDDIDDKEENETQTSEIKSSEKNNIDAGSELETLKPDKNYFGKKEAEDTKEKLSHSLERTEMPDKPFEKIEIPEENTEGKEPLEKNKGISSEKEFRDLFKVNSESKENIDGSDDNDE